MFWEPAVNKLEPGRLEIGCSRARWARTSHAMPWGSSDHGRPRRDRLQRVDVCKYFWPGCHRMEPYRTLYPEAGRDLPHTEEVAGRVIVLPTGTAVAPEMICAIVNLLRMTA